MVFAGLTGVAIWYLAHGEMLKAAGWFTNGILAVFFFFGTLYLQMTFRSSHDFVKLARANVAEGAAGLVGLAFVALLGFYGLCLRVVLAAATSAALLFRWRPVRVRPRWDWGDLRHLFKIGAPIFAVGQVQGLWVGVITSTLVLRFTGTKGMGLYAMVLVAISALEVVPLAVAQVVYPRMSQEYGGGCTTKHLIRIARKPMLATCAGLSVVVVAGWFAAAPLVRLVIPNYVDAVPAMQWGLLIALIGSFRALDSIFNVVRRQDLYLAAVTLGIGAFVGALFLLTHHAVYLAAFPQAMVIGRAVNVVADYLFILYLQRKERRAAPPTGMGRA